MRRTIVTLVLFPLILTIFVDCLLPYHHMTIMQFIQVFLVLLGLLIGMGAAGFVAVFIIALVVVIVMLGISELISRYRYAKKKNTDGYAASR